MSLSKHSLLSSSSLKFGEFLVMSLNSMKSKLPFVDKEVRAKKMKRQNIIEMLQDIKLNFQEFPSWFSSTLVITSTIFEDGKEASGTSWYIFEGLIRFSLYSCLPFILFCSQSYYPFNCYHKHGYLHINARRRWKV